MAISDREFIRLASLYGAQVVQQFGVPNRLFNATRASDVRPSHSPQPGTARQQRIAGTQPVQAFWRMLTGRAKMTRRDCVIAQ